MTVGAWLQNQNGTQPAVPQTTGFSYVKPYDPALTGVTTEQLDASRRYLIASFPAIRQVAYCHLPDNVWRPLVMGVVAEPTGLAVDTANARLFVADPAASKIFWYQLTIRSDGLLWTTGQQYVAVDGYSAKWLAVNGVGDLYFTGKATVTPPTSSYEAVYRQDAVKLIKGMTLEPPKEVYTRSNSGAPNPKVWMPSGIGVDSFSIYWANQESGTTYGSIVKAPRLNIAHVSSSGGATTLDTAFDEVRGLMVTTTNVYFLTPAGVFGLPKSTSSPIDDASQGLVASIASGDSNTGGFDPRSIAWDGDGTAYVTDPTAGVVYSVPAMDLETHQFTKYADAPGVAGVAVANFDSYVLVAGFSESGATNEARSTTVRGTSEQFRLPLLAVVALLAIANLCAM